MPRVRAERIFTAFLLLLLLALRPASAQQLSDTLRLKVFEVTATRLATFSPGAKVEMIDSATMARHASSDLATLLANDSPVFIKSYGLGSLATSSFRGGSANHTAVLWNGFNISSPMNGQLDLALIPMGVMNSVRIQYGAGTALWGSGAVGGTIHLDHVPRFEQDLTLSAGISFGSFNDQRYQLGATFGGVRWAASVALLQASARNDFHYTNTALPGSPECVQHNAGLEQQALVAQVHHRIKARQRIHLAYWFQQSDRAIPPTMHQVESTARQEDGTHRITGGWQYTGRSTTLEARAAWFDEDQLWYPFGTDAVRSRSRTAIAEAEVRHRFATKHTVSAGINANHARAVSDGYPDEPRQDRAALFLAYLYNGREGRVQHTLSARQEVMDDAWVPFTASAGSTVKLTDQLHLRATAAKVYRIPTFNDLFWVPGGDRDLLSESGWSGEAGLSLQRELRSVRLKCDGTVYSRTLDNWIIWLPGPAYWSPQNVMQVWSRGVETRAEVAVPIQRTTVALSVLTNYVVSTNQVAKSVNDDSVGRQLIYVPMYSGHARLAVSRGTFSLAMQLNYTGYRYTSTDNRSYLEPFTLGNAWASYAWKTGKRHTLALELQANNLFDTAYQTIADRPMPLRNYRMAVRLYFNGTKSPRTEIP